MTGCGDFTVLPISPGSVQITQTDNNNNDPFFAQGINVTVQPLNGYGGTVSLSCSVSPPLTGGSCTVNPPTSGSLAAGNLSTTLTISVGASTPDGPYTVTVQAQDDSGLMHSQPWHSPSSTSPPLPMVTGGAGPPTQVNFGPGPGTVNNLSCPLVTGTGINGSEDFGLIGGVCSFNPTTTNLPSPGNGHNFGLHDRTAKNTHTHLRFVVASAYRAWCYWDHSERKPLVERKLYESSPSSCRYLFCWLEWAAEACGQTTPSGSYQVLVQGTGTDGTVYSAVIPVTVTPLGQ